jgi:hypothetical protein
MGQGTTDLVVPDFGLRTGMKKSMMTPKSTRYPKAEQGNPREFEKSVFFPQPAHTARIKKRKY